MTEDPNDFGPHDAQAAPQRVVAADASPDLGGLISFTFSPEDLVGSVFVSAALATPAAQPGVTAA